MPNGATDTATFDVSTITALALQSSVEVDSIVFDAGASAYTIDTGSSAILTLSGAGIVNNSGLTQNFLIPDIYGAQMIIFTNSASAGSKVVVTNNGSNGTFGADILFQDSSSAGDTTITNNGTVYFQDRATAGRATFINNPADAVNQSAGFTYFSNPGISGAVRATFINNGAAVRGAYGGSTAFYSAGSLGGSTVIVNGGTVPGARGGNLDLGVPASAGNATLIANGGSNGGDGGSLTFINTADGGTSRVELFGNGYLDLRYPQGFPRTTTIGSLEGNGKVYLGGNKLLVGSNNRTTVFSGEILELGSQGNTAGSFGKIGDGRLVLQRANNYSGGTVLLGGELVVNNTINSGTGTGPVAVKAGTLSGGGIIAGPAAIGSGSGTGASLAPGKTPVTIGTLTLQSTLVFNSDASYSCGVNSSSGVADKVIANGVTINDGAQVLLNETGSGTIGLGTVFTAIDNTAATPITGTFANLANGATTTVGSNAFQADYEGGDGNDLTLTVVP